MANLRDVAQTVEKRSKHKLARGTVDLPLPIFDGQYAGRFGVLEADRIAELERLAGEVESITPDDSLDASSGFLADACRVIVGRAVAGGKWERLEHDDGRPVRFDEDFAEVLGLEPPPGREAFTGMHEVVLACFTVEEADGERTINAPALHSFAIGLLGWMQDTRRHVEGELVGELNGAPARA